MGVFPMVNVNSVVIKLGGSVLFPRDVSSDLFLEKIRCLVNFVSFAREFNDSLKIFFVIGGGSWAKSYIRFAESLGVSPIVRDLFGIEISRLNAFIVVHLLKRFLRNVRIYNGVPKTPEEALRVSSHSDIIVLGGFYPGQSTIGTAALLAEIVEADLLLIGTDVNGVYLSDPKKNVNAKKFDTISIGELVRILSGLEVKPGTYMLMDLVAAKVLERAKIPCIVFDVSKCENLFKVYEAFIKEDFEKIYEVGTLIVR